MKRQTGRGTAAVGSHYLRKETVYKLFFSPGSAAMAPQAVLEEVGAPYELVEVDVAANEHQGAAYKKLNPNGLGDVDRSRALVASADRHVDRSRASVASADRHVDRSRALRPRAPIAALSAAARRGFECRPSG